MTKKIIQENKDLEKDDLVDGSDSNDDLNDNPTPPLPPTPRGRQANSVRSEAKPFNNYGVTDKQELSLTEDAQRTKAFMDKQPKVPYIYPLNFGEKKGAEITVTTNGYKLTIMKGVRVMIPEPMARDLDAERGIQEEAALDRRVDMASKDVQDALTA